MIALTAYAAEPTLSEIETRLRDLGYSENVIQRNLADPKQSPLVWRVRKELESPKVPLALTSPLRAVRLYRGIMIFPTEYKPGFVGYVAEKHDPHIYFTPSLSEAEHYGRPVGWQEWMGDQHPYRGIVLEIEVPSSDVYVDSWKRVGFSTSFNEEPYVRRVGSWQFSPQYKEGLNSQPDWFEFEKVYQRGKGFNESQMTEIQSVRPKAECVINSMRGLLHFFN
jgi:hypothetical protein